MPSVLCLVSHYLPGYKSGGPQRSVSNIAKELSDQCEFKIITSDRDYGDLVPYSEVDLDTWTIRDNAHIFYATKRVWLRYIQVCRGGIDTIYLNSFFDFKFGIFAVLIWKLMFSETTRMVLAPRGQFSVGALQLKRRKKMLFILVSRYTGLHRRITWHASTEFEAMDIRNVIQDPDLDICVVQNMVKDSNQASSSPTCSNLSADRSVLKLCFVSRISRKKNLKFALAVLSQLDIPIVFNVYGPAEDEQYFAECKKISNKLPSNILVKYLGGIEHSRIHEVLEKHHLFFFPTLGENFGHVIAESLSAGTPVLISDQTPWRNLKQSGVGWDLSLDRPEKFSAVIASLASMRTSEYLLFRNNAASYELGENIIELGNKMMNMFFPSAPQ